MKRFILGVGLGLLTVVMIGGGGGHFATESRPPNG